MLFRKKLLLFAIIPIIVFSIFTLSSLYDLKIMPRYVYGDNEIKVTRIVTGYDNNDLRVDKATIIGFSGMNNDKIAWGGNDMDVATKELGNIHLNSHWTSVCTSSSFGQLCQHTMFYPNQKMMLKYSSAKCSINLEFPDGKNIVYSESDFTDLKNSLYKNQKFSEIKDICSGKENLFSITYQEPYGYNNTGIETTYGTNCDNCVVYMNGLQDLHLDQDEITDEWFLDGVVIKDGSES